MTGRDHPRRAGLALHLGAASGLPTIGVTHRPLAARGDWPPLQRGASSFLFLNGKCVGRWLCTKSGARPLAIGEGWRLDLDTAQEVVLLASSETARTPRPLRAARQLAREACALAEGKALGPAGPVMLES